MNSRRIWITWETQRRNRELAEAFGCTFLPFDFSDRPALVRYLLSAWKTVRAVFAESPKVVFVQCPSILLIGLTALLKIFRSFVLVIDAHNVAFDYLNSSQPVLRSLMRFGFKSADLVLVSNAELEKNLEPFGRKSAVLADRLPTISPRAASEQIHGVAGPVVTLISSFAPDEPIEAFLQAGALVQKEKPFTLFVTGKISRAGRALGYRSDSIRFTDFLSEGDYEALIGHSNLLVDLTTRENCLVCGAYEAIAVGVPVLLSDTAALRATFPLGTIFAANDPAGYTAALGKFFLEENRLRNDIVAMKNQFEKTWSEQFHNVELELAKKVNTSV